MRSRVIISTAIAVLACGVVLAAGPDRVSLDNVNQAPETGNTRTLGTFTSISVTLQQTGVLEGEVGVSAATSGGSAHTTAERVLLYGQIYDYPWQAPYGTANTFVSGDSTIIPRTPDGGPFSASFTFTVPVINTFQAWGLVYVGWSPHVPGFTSTYPTSGFWWYDNTYAAGNTAYIDDVQPPTPTAPPGGYGGEPIPTLNWLGILAMIAIMAGVAVLVMVGRK